MTNETDFTVTVRGREFDVHIDDGRRAVHQGLLQITDRASGTEVCNSSGYCNPLVPFWNSAESLLEGEERAAKIEQIIKDTVEVSLQELHAFYLDVLGDEDTVDHWDKIVNVLTATGFIKEGAA